MGIVDPLDDAIRVRLTERFGAGVAPWLDALPANADALAARWTATIERDAAGRARVQSGRTSVIFHVRLATGEPAVLKLTPEPALAREEGAALAAADARSEAVGDGVVGAAGSGAGGGLPALPRLYACDGEAGALLMEAVVPGTVVAELAEPCSAEAVAALLTRLRGVAPVASLPPLADRVAFIFALWERRLAESAAAQEQVPLALLARGHELARSLADGYRGVPSFVHGDLHPGNALDGGAARGLVAIDPRPCVGDPGFDAVDLALWGAERVDEADARIARIAARTGDDPARLRAWCASLAAMLAASLALRPGASERRLAMLLELAA